MPGRTVLERATFHCVASVLRVEPLYRHHALAARVRDWLLSEWPDWYGPGGPGTLNDDVAAFTASPSRLPIGFLVFDRGEPIGFGALKTESIPTHKHLSPWAAAGYVLPSWRGRGVGSVLLRGIVAHASALGFAHVYCGTSSAITLLRRAGWAEVDATVLEGKPLAVFRSERTVFNSLKLSEDK